MLVNVLDEMSKLIKIQNKLTLLNAICERKAMRFDCVTDDQEQVEAWKSVHIIAHSLQLASADQSWQLTRGKMYGLLVVGVSNLSKYLHYFRFFFFLFVLRVITLNVLFFVFFFCL